MVRSKVLFRADGNHKIGLGHVYRSIAMAEIISKQFDFSFAIRDPLPGIVEIIRNAGGRVYALPETTDNAAESQELREIAAGYDFVVLDGYHFDTAYQRTLKRDHQTLISIDDIHAYHFVSDAVINIAGGATPAWYSAEQYTRFFLGIKYSLLRKPFRDAAKNRSLSQHDFDQVFISIGGADTNNFTLHILQQLQKKVGGTFTFHVVTGEAYQHATLLSAFVSSVKNVKWHTRLSSEAMMSLMKQCGSAICAPSGVAYEYSSVGGVLYLFQTADNQTDVRRFLLDQGLAFSFEAFPVRDETLQAQMLARQAAQFDGSSELNVQRIFTAFEMQQKAQLRRVVSSDLELLFRWANDPETRRSAFHSGAISLDEHRSWFAKKLTDGNAYMYIFEVEKIPVGQIRFDISDSAVITYAIDEKFRGFGLGTEILRKSMPIFRRESGFDGVITAYVKEENTNSRSVFLRSGFSETFDEKKNSFKYILAYAGN